MTIAVDWDVKHRTKQTNNILKANKIYIILCYVINR